MKCTIYIKMEKTYQILWNWQHITQNLETQKQNQFENELVSLVATSFVFIFIISHTFKKTEVFFYTFIVASHIFLLLFIQKSSAAHSKYNWDALLTKKRNDFVTRAWKVFVTQIRFKKN